MRRKSSGFYSSSLEMLLDTMCNMLGGVVFIALMVAVVARDSTTMTTAAAPATPTVPAQELATVIASNKLADAELQAVLQRLQDPHVRPQTNVMRLPHLENTHRQPWMMIAQYGKIYPLDVLPPDTNGGPLLNRFAINYQPGSHYLETRPGKGLEAEYAVTNLVQAFKDHSRTNYYFAFLVYDDSFPAFVRAREIAVKLGYQYGWDPLPHNQRLQVGDRGDQVLPQN